METFVQLDPLLQDAIALLVTAVVSFLILQLTAVVPALAEYLGAYKVGIVTWLTGLVVQLIQAQLDQIPASWETVAIVVMQLIVEVVLVLFGFSFYRKSQMKGSAALQA